ncbi:NADase-type glycan-binding domain-containing protein [Streptomyces sp. NPDC048696]|uniref:zinc ribbon domain-containing protein n=1 Tax=Streptomyces sp. NPDC048696 TaxID=3365585 RepID=UPI00371DDF92
MRTCPQCGASNGPDDDFCGNCGSYLGWSDPAHQTSTGDDAPEPPAPAHHHPDAPHTASSPDPTAEADAPAATTRTSTSRTSSLRTRLTGRARRDPEESRVPGAPGVTAGPGVRPWAPDTDSASPGRGPAAEPRPDPAADAGSQAPQEVTPPPDGPAADDHVRADSTAPAATSASASAPEPTAPDATGDRPPAAAEQPAQPAPVLPAKPVAARPTVRPVTATEEEAGLPCGACGTLNQPERRFCRRCAAPLHPAAPTAPLPWWRTVWPFRRRVRAGSGRGVRLLVALAAVVALAVAVFLLLPAGRALFEDTKDKLGGTKAITPANITASAELPGHPATNTTDGLRNRYWGAPKPGATVTYTFDKPFRLVDLIITNGASVSPEQYAQEARALQMDMTATSANGTTHRKTLSLSDKPGPQTLVTGFDDVVTVRLELRSVTGLTPGRHIALAEVEFFQRS